MTTLIILICLGIFFLISLVIRRKRKEKLEVSANAIGFIEVDAQEVFNSLLYVLSRTFLFAKGNYIQFHSVFKKQNGSNNNYIIDWVYSSTGNQDITYQRTVFIFELHDSNLPQFVLETIDLMSRITKKDLDHAGFRKMNSIETRSYLKTNEPYQPLVNIPELRRLLDKYKPLSLEHQLGYLFVYFNSSKSNKHGIEEFYQDLMKIKLLTN